MAFSGSFFSKLAKEDLAELNDHKKSVLYKKNHYIFTAGARPEAIYCLMEGRIKIYKTGADGKQMIIRLVKPGEFFGLRTAVTKDFYITTAVALEESKVCIISNNVFHQMLCKYPGFTNFIIAFLCDRLDEANSRLLSLAQKPVRERLAEMLLILGDVFGDRATGGKPDGEINLSREDLANIIGTAPETVIRLLSEFKNDALISINGRKVSLLNTEGLKRIARI